MSDQSDIRRIASEDAIPVGVLLDFILKALHHDAIRDELTERIVFRAERGELHVHSLSALLPDLIGEVLDVATNEDWMAVAELLIDDARAMMMEEGAAP